MRRILLIVLFVGLLLVYYVGVNYANNYVSKKEPILNDKYQGPVPEGYDLKHFRNTGETILEVVD